MLSQYNVGAQTRRTENIRWLEEDVLEIHEADAETRGISREIGWLFEVEWVRLVCGPKYLMRLQRGGLHDVSSPHDWHQCDNYGLERLGDQLP